MEDKLNLKRSNLESIDSKKIEVYDLFSKNQVNQLSVLISYFDT